MHRTKQQLILAGLTLLAAGLACSLGAQAPATEPSLVPETEAGEDGTVTQESLPTEPAPPAEAGPGSQVAAVLDLAALPSGPEVAPNYSEHFVMVWEGTGLDGQPLVQEWDFLTHWFTDPQPGYTTQIHVTENQALQTTNQTSVFEGQSYFYDDTSGCIIFPASPEDTQPAGVFGNDFELAGTAALVESGLQVNGLLVDRYSLGNENLASTASLEPGEYTLDSGDLFYARELGYATRLVLAGSSDSRDFTFNGSADFVYTLDVEPLPAGSTPALPDGCQGSVIGGLDFPRSQDAYELITMPNGLFYKSHLSLDDLLDLYRQELPPQGWAPVDESVFEAMATMVFEKEGRSLNVQLIVNADETSVSLVEEP